MLILDAHLDLAMNALEWNRDLSRPIEEIRDREQSLTDKPDRGRGTVSFAEMRRGRAGLCVATQIARYVAPGNSLSGWHSQEQAWAMAPGWPISFFVGRERACSSSCSARRSP